MSLPLLVTGTIGIETIITPISNNKDTSTKTAPITISRMLF